MRIEGNESLQLLLPEGEKKRLLKALALLGYESDENSLLTVLEKRTARGDGYGMTIEMVGGNAITLEMKRCGSPFKYYCRLEVFEEGAPVLGEELQKKLFHALSEVPEVEVETVVSSRPAPPTRHRMAPIPSPPLPPPVLRPVERPQETRRERVMKVRGQGFSNRSKDVTAFLERFREDHGDTAAVSKAKVSELLLELVDTDKPGMIINALVRKGYLISENGAFKALEKGQQPLPAEASNTRKKKSVIAELPADDPAVSRLLAVQNVLQAQAEKRGALGAKEAELKRLQQLAEGYASKVAALAREIEQDKDSILTEEDLAGIDEMLAKLQNKEPAARAPAPRAVSAAAA